MAKVFTMGRLLALIFIISMPANAQDLIFSDGFEVCDCQSILKTSPADGESGISLTRETIIRFSGPINPSTVTSQSIFAEFRGAPLAMRRHVSPDHTTVSLFYTNPLPASARVRITIRGDLLRSESGDAVDVFNSGLAGGTRTIDFDTLAVTTLPGTVVTGTVYASELDPVNVPLEGVTITVDGHEDELFAVTDSSGNFRLDPAPVGKFFVHIDGRTATNPVPAGGYYPFVGKPWESVAGNEISIGNVHLPLVPSGTLQTVSDSEPTAITFAPSILSQFPDFEGAQITVPADSLFANNGIRGGMVGIAPVAPDRLPGTLPANLQFPLVITVQTNGPTNFDIPAPICFPNMPDPVTEAPLAAGEKNYLYSFNHDKGVWEAIGSMTVSNDGTLICTDPGVGILAPGWHGSGPPPLEPPPPGQCAGGGEGGSPQQQSATHEPNQLERLGQEWAFPAAISTEQCKASAQSSFEFFNAVCFAYIVSESKDCHARFPSDSLIDRLRRHACTTAAARKFSECSKREKEYFDWMLAQCEPDTPAGDCITSDSGWEFSNSSGKFLVEAEPIRGLVIDEPPPLPDPVAEGIAQKYRMIADLLEPYGVLPIPEAVMDEVDALIQEADALGEGDAGEYLFNFARVLDIQIADIRDSLEIRLENAPKRSLLYHARIKETSTPLLLSLRGETAPLGQYTLFSPRDSQLLSVNFYDPVVKVYGRAEPYYDPNAAFGIGRLSLTLVDETFRDDDEDGLADVVEDIYGTDPFNPDTDGDGILDGAEVEQGLDPLGDFVAQTGIIATLDTPGSAVDIDSLNNRSAVANESGGLTLLDVTNGKNPIEIGYLATPEPATRVALAGNDAVVAIGTAGLAIVDITDPPALSIRRQVGLGGAATSVATVGGLAYAGTADGMVSVVDIDSGFILQRFFLDSQVRDLGIGLNEIYALTNNTLYTIAPVTSPDGILSSVASPLINANGTTMINRRLAVGTDRIHAVHSRGYNVFDLSVPDIPSLLVSGESGQVGWHDMAANGSGLGIAAVGPNLVDPPYDVQDFDLSSDIADGSNFLTQHTTPGETQAVSIFGGIAYVADGANGVQVVNYLPYDTQGQAPLIGIEASFSLTPAEAVEGQQVVVRADVSDDVQVRKVEFFIDEVLAITDGNFPFSHGFVVPLLIQQSSFTVRARATDTGGNTADTDTIEVTILPDTTPPFVANAHPNTGSRPLDQVRAFFNEPIDPATVNTTSFSLESIPSPGAGGTPVPANSVSFAPTVNGAILELPVLLNDGYYRATISDAVTDLAGNPMDGPFSWEFQIADAVFWISQFNGNWEEGYRWDTGNTPQAGDDVFISVPTGIEVTINSPTPALSSIVSTELLRVNSTLTVNGTILNNGGLTLAGTLINAHVLPESTHDVGGAGATIRNVRMGKTISPGIGNNQALRVEDGLTLDGAIVVWGGQGSSFSTASLNGNTPYTINGTGEFFLGNGNNNIGGNADITLGPDITLRGYGSRFSPGSVMTNEGTIHSDLPGQLIFGAAGKTVINNGIIKGTGGGSIGIDGNWTNNASITIQDGGTLGLYGTYDNQGTIVATDSTVFLGGNFTLAGLGDFSRTGSSVTIIGVLNNAPGLVLDATTGGWLINGGQIIGGVIETLDGVSLIAQNRNSVLDGVTIDGTVGIGASSSVTFLNGLTVNGQVVIAGSTGSLYASAVINGASPVTIDGTGEIFFGGGGNFISGSADVIIGPNMTLRGQSGGIRPDSVLTNEGTVHSDLPGQLIFGAAGKTVINNGIMKGTGGGSIGIDGNWTNNTSITIQDDGTLGLYGTYDNQGTIVATDSTVFLGGNFTLAGLGDFSRTGGSVTLTGVLNNAPGLILDANTGGWVINGGQIIGGVIETLDGVSLSVQNRSSVLEGVTVDGAVSVGASSSVTFINDLTVNGQVVIAGSTGSLYASAAINSASPVTIDGTGEIFFGGGDNFIGGTAEVTLGPDFTLRGQVGRFSPGSILINEGTIHSDLPGTLTIGTTGMTVTNEGLIKGSAGGSLVVWGLASNDGTFQLGPGSALQAQETGYTQSASGALIIDIRGLGAANHGQLNSTNGVTLAGSLTLNLVDAFQPDIGDVFTIVTGPSITGTFDTINGLDIGGGKQFNVIYNAANIVLEVVATP